MSKVVNLLTKEQLETLQDVCDVMDHAITDKQSAYRMKLTDEHGTHDYVAGRDEYLESVMDYVLTTLGCVFHQLN
ncbi:hypothetical protein [Lysinibacillus sp. FSL K6-3209]|uniref:hypothetical protein n=1 Tax=Lysinibacillus sp. FSL K6-3209 TaxID=2921497 RepID=UPI0030DBF059